MKYTGFFLAIATGLSLVVSAQRQQLNFDNDWKFQFGHAANAEKDFNYSIANIFSKSGAASPTPGPFFG